MLDHVGFAVSDYERSKRFVSIEAQGRPFRGRLHVAFAVEDRDTVDELSAAALAAGATDNGAPGVREIYHSN